MRLVLGAIVVAAVLGILLLLDGGGGPATVLDGRGPVGGPDGPDTTGAPRPPGGAVAPVPFAPVARPAPPSVLELRGTVRSPVPVADVRVLLALSDARRRDPAASADSIGMRLVQTWHRAEPGEDGRWTFRLPLPLRPATDRRLCTATVLAVGTRGDDRLAGVLSVSGPYRAGGGWAVSAYGRAGTSAGAGRGFAERVVALDGRRLRAELLLEERDPFVISVSGEAPAGSGGPAVRPLAAGDDLRVTVALCGFRPPFHNCTLEVRPRGDRVRVFGLPWATRLGAEAPGFEPWLEPRDVDWGAPLPPGVYGALLARVEPKPRDAALAISVRSAVRPRVVVIGTRWRAARDLEPAGGRTSPGTSAERTWSRRLRVPARRFYDVFVLTGDRTRVLLGVYADPGENPLPGPDAGGTDVTGSVRRDGRPLAGAEVEWLHAARGGRPPGFPVRATTTGDAGRFALPGVVLPASLRVRAGGVHVVPVTGPHAEIDLPR